MARGHWPTDTETLDVSAFQLLGTLVRIPCRMRFILTRRCLHGTKSWRVLGVVVAHRPLVSPFQAGRIKRLDAPTPDGRACRKEPDQVDNQTAIHQRSPGAASPPPRTAGGGIRPNSGQTSCLLLNCFFCAVGQPSVVGLGFLEDHLN